jgi:hypothetical protein
MIAPTMPPKSKISSSPIPRPTVKIRIQGRATETEEDHSADHRRPFLTETSYRSEPVLCGHHPVAES